MTLITLILIKNAKKLQPHLAYACLLAMKLEVLFFLHYKADSPDFFLILIYFLMHRIQVATIRNNQLIKKLMPNGMH